MSSKTSSDLTFMVNKLNEILETNLTLVEFDEISRNREKLLTLLNQVLTYLGSQERMPVESTDESPEQTVTRMKQFFVKVLNIKQLKQMDPTTFGHGLLSGNKSVIFPVLHNVLSRVEELRTRVYLSRYLMPIKVPEELFSFEDVRETDEQYQLLMKEFRKAHQQFTQLKQSTSNPMEWKKSIFKMQQQKEQLKTRIAEQKKKVRETHPDWESLITVASELRIQVDKEKKFQDQIQEQGQELEKFDRTLHQLQHEYSNKQKQIGEPDVEVLVKKLEKDVRQKREKLNDTIPGRIREFEEQVEAMQSLQHKPINVAYSDLESSIRSILEEISSSEQTLLDLQNKPKQADRAATAMKRQAAMIKHRRRDVESKLSSLRKEQDKLTQKHQQIEQQLREYEGQKIPSEEEFEKYKKDLLTKVQKTKSMSQDLSRIRAEIAVLKRSEEILTTRHKDAADFLEKLARSKGVSGFRDVQNQIEELSINKSNVDKQKGQTLEEISRVVEKLKQEIAAKKQELTPSVEKLRDVRQKSQNISNEYESKKAVYENVRMGYESERERLNEEILELKHVIDQSESLYHQLTAQIELTEIEKQRVEQEESFRSGKGQLNEKHKTYQDWYQAVLKQLETESKELREEQRYISENHEPNLKQIEYFNNLKKLLEHKMHFARNPNGDVDFADDILTNDRARDEQVLQLSWVVECQSRHEPPKRILIHSFCENIV